MNKIKPPLKWVGGKTKLLQQIINKIKILKTKQNFYDPFGGGSVSISLSNYFEKVVKNNTRELISILDCYSKKYIKEFNYKTRAIDREITYTNLRDSEKSTRMIYLNKTRFNWLYRINLSDYFNVPIEKNGNKLYEEENILKFSRLLNTIFEIVNKDYKDYLDKDPIVYVKRLLGLKVSSCNEVKKILIDNFNIIDVRK